MTFELAAKGKEFNLNYNISNAQDKKTRTRNAIVDAAKQAFLTNGYYKTDMGQIAKAAGIDKRTIYRYFSSKEALAFVIWQNVLAFVIDFGMDTKGETGYLRISNLLYHYIEGVKENQNLIRFLGEVDYFFSGEYPNIEEADNFVKYILYRGHGTLLECIEEGISDGSLNSELNAELAASTISNILFAISQRIVLRGEHLKIEQGYSYEMLDECVRMLLDSIKAI